jgi:hypothetical protein
MVDTHSDVPLSQPISSLQDVPSSTDSDSSSDSDADSSCCDRDNDSDLEIVLSTSNTDITSSGSITDSVSAADRGSAAGDVSTAGTSSGSITDSGSAADRGSATGDVSAAGAETDTNCRAIVDSGTAADSSATHPLNATSKVPKKTVNNTKLASKQRKPKTPMNQDTHAASVASTVADVIARLECTIVTSLEQAHNGKYHAEITGLLSLVEAEKQKALRWENDYKRASQTPKQCTQCTEIAATNKHFSDSEMMYLKHIETLQMEKNTLIEKCGINERRINDLKNDILDAENTIARLGAQNAHQTADIDLHRLTTVQLEAKCQIAQDELIAHKEQQSQQSFEPWTTVSTGKNKPSVTLANTAILQPSMTDSPVHNLPNNIHSASSDHMQENEFPPLPTKATPPVNPTAHCATTSAKALTTTITPAAPLANPRPTSPNKPHSTTEIREVIGHWDPLSNFFPCSLNIDGLNYKSTESYYQTEKAEELGLQKVADQIRRAKHAGVVKAIANDNLKKQETPQWHRRKVSVMMKALKYKYQQCPQFRDALKQCQGKQIVEFVRSEPFWGCGYDGKGHNMLGKCLMQMLAHPPMLQQPPAAPHHQQEVYRNTQQHMAYSGQPQSHQPTNTQQAPTPSWVNKSTPQEIRHSNGSMSTTTPGVLPQQPYPPQSTRTQQNTATIQLQHPQEGITTHTVPRPHHQISPNRSLPSATPPRFAHQRHSHNNVPANTNEWYQNKPRVILIGNSHLASINPEGLSPHYRTEKYIAYTISQAHDTIDTIPSPRQVQSVILHLITNDVKTSISAVIAHQHAALVEKCKQHFPNAQVFISLALCRADNEMWNNRICTVNFQLEEMFYNTERVTLINNSSLCSNSWPIRQFFAYDGVHLSQSGTSILAAHFRAALEGKEQSYHYKL